MALNRQEVLAAVAARAAETKIESVPEWGGDVCIRRLSPAELKSIGFFGGSDPGEFLVRLLAAALADENGVPLFTKDDFKELAKADFVVVNRVFEKAAKFCGLNDDDVKDAAETFAEAQPESSSSS